MKRGVSAGLPKPPGGGTYAYGFHSIINTTGCTFLYVDDADFTPTLLGGSFSDCLQRAPSSGKTGFSPFIAVCAQGNAVTDKAYMLGLGDGDPSHIILRKGAMSDGLPDVAPGTQGVLARSTDTYDIEEYQHLKLEVQVNPSGDTIINVYRNDLTVHDADSPVWVAIPGMARFIDDAMGINSALAGLAVADILPYGGGYMGFGMTVSNIGRRAYFDYHAPVRQV